MNNLLQRKYSRIFSGTNQTDGYENIHLGYQANTTEITLLKDKFTYFHIPFFSPTTYLVDSTLTMEGAVPGPIPAMADRIYKKQGNYGTHTNWGHNTGVQDGTWLCSWFCSISGEEGKWLDRYYNPAILTYEEALQGQTSFTIPYTAHNPAFADIDSQMTLEPGVLYQYYRVGEQTCQSIINTFAGDNLDKLKLSIDNYNANIVDNSIYNNPGVIDNFKSTWANYETNINYTSGYYLDFNNTDFINARVYYKNDYNLTDQFTLNVFIKHNDWANSTSSQIVGNYFDSGYSLYYNNLKNYPFFVIPENTYGHIFYFNQEMQAFLDQSTFDNSSNSNIAAGTPIQISLNGERDTYVLNNFIDSNNSVYQSSLMRFNHLGDNTAIFTTGTTTITNNSTNVEVGKQFIIDSNNNITLFTTNATYTLDKDLNVITSNNIQVYSDGQQIAYDKDGNLKIDYNSKQIIFDNNNNKWSIIPGVNNVYINDVFQPSLPNNVTNIAIAPDNNIWLLHDINQTTVVDPVTFKTINTFTIGVLENTEVYKNISFIYAYDRTQNTSTWYALYYFNVEQALYVVSLDGNIVDVISFSSCLSPVYTQTPYNQIPEKLTFTGTGDFTGYEWSRINNTIAYNNIPQLQFKIYTTDHQFGSIPKSYIVTIPTLYFTDNTWYNISCIYENHTMKLYINNSLEGTLSIPYNRDITYEKENDLYIGCPNGKAANINKEINSTSVIFNGQIDTVSIYDYAISENYLQYFINSKIVSSDLIWGAPTGNLQYIETIERFFKHKMPGAKSQFFKIKISGSQITDPNTRAVIEEYIKATIERSKPAYTELLLIEWV
jgi:hypothetical protein